MFCQPCTYKRLWGYLCQNYSTWIWWAISTMRTSIWSSKVGICKLTQRRLYWADKNLKKLITGHLLLCCDIGESFGKVITPVTKTILVVIPQQWHYCNLLTYILMHWGFIIGGMLFYCLKMKGLIFSSIQRNHRTYIILFYKRVYNKSLKERNFVYISHQFF